MYKACWGQQGRCKNYKTSQNEIIHVSYNENVIFSKGNVSKEEPLKGLHGLRINNSDVTKRAGIDNGYDNLFRGFLEAENLF